MKISITSLEVDGPAMKDRFSYLPPKSSPKGASSTRTPSQAVTPSKR